MLPRVKSLSLASVLMFTLSCGSLEQSERTHQPKSEFAEANNAALAGSLPSCEFVIKKAITLKINGQQCKVYPIDPDSLVSNHGVVVPQTGPSAGGYLTSLLPSCASVATSDVPLILMGLACKIYATTPPDTDDFVSNHGVFVPQVGP